MTTESSCHSRHKDIDSIINDDSIVKSRKQRALYWSVLNNNIILEDVKELTPAVNPVDLNLGDFSYAA